MARGVRALLATACRQLNNNAGADSSISAARPSRCVMSSAPRPQARESRNSVESQRLHRGLDSDLQLGVFLGEIPRKAAKLQLACDTRSRE